MTATASPHSLSSSILFLFEIYLFISLFLATPDLRCCRWALSSCGKRGLLFVAMCGCSLRRLLLLWGAGSRHQGLQQLQHVGSAAVHRLSCSEACGIFPDQGLNPCLLHWQVISPVSHQGSPSTTFLIMLLGIYAHISPLALTICFFPDVQSNLTAHRGSAQMPPPLQSLPDPTPFGSGGKDLSLL